MNLYLIVAFRIVSIMILLLFSTLFIMGKRPIGELPVFDFLSIIVLGSVVGADIADPNSNHLLIALAIIILSLLQRIVSVINLKCSKLRKVLNFEPTVVIHNGQIVYKNLKKINYTMDELTMLLREKDIFNLDQVSYAIIEASGKISVLKKSGYETITLQDMKLPTAQKGLPYKIILEGKFDEKNLKILNASKEEVVKKLKTIGFSNYRDIFYASMDMYKNIVVCEYYDEKI